MEGPDKAESVEGPECVWQHQHHKQRINAIELSPTQDCIFTASGDCTIGVLDWGTGQA